MEDLYFEKELRNREKEKVKRRLEQYSVYFQAGDKMSETTRQVFQNFDEVLDTYYSKKYGNTKNYDEIYEMVEAFKSQLTDDELSAMYHQHKFSQEEMDYIKLVQISSTWRGEHQFNIGAQYAIIDILLREKIIEQFGEDAFIEFREILQNELPKTEAYRKMTKHYMQLLSDNPYGENLHAELEEYIEKETTYWFNEIINCGGYALKVDTSVYPTYQDNFSQSISSILDKFPFVRLLGDKLLEEDEYLVIYRAPQGKNTGHHFIRVDSDGVVREKDANEEPRIFQNWKNLEEAKEALFAVKKEHKMFGYDANDVNHNNKGLDFEESVSQAIKEKQNMFSYHDHSFCLKKSKQDEIFVTTTDGEIAANVLFDENECLVEIMAGKKEYIENISGILKPIIRNGKLINFEQFRTKNLDGIEEEGR